MRFELGKYYRHTSGKMLHIIAVAETSFYGTALIAEDEGGRLQPCGFEEANAKNYVEITQEAWLAALQDPRPHGAVVHGQAEVPEGPRSGG